jgi:ribosomal protein S18 acetylase RimI-like enzyme
MDFVLIQATEKDRDYLLTLRKNTMVAHLEKAGMFLAEAEHLVRLNDAYECSHIVHYDGERIGTLKYQQTVETINIMQIQIEPELQGRGYGRRLIEQVLSDATVKTVALTVLKENPALALYKRLGFLIVGEDNYEFHLQINV